MNPVRRYHRRQRARARIRRGMKDYTPHPVELDSEMVAYLNDIVKVYSLTDIGKAVRCLVNYARENEAKRDEIFSDVRCMGC
jgi:hypothetical protein